MTPGTQPRTVSALDTTRHPASTLSKVTSADTSSRSGGVPARPSAPDRAIEKQAAWAAARSSSGLVLPSDDSVRAAHDTGSSEKLPDDMAETVPDPVARAPDQVASARRIAAIVISLSTDRAAIVPYRPSRVACGQQGSGVVRSLGGRSSARTNATRDRDGAPIPRAVAGREHRVMVNFTRRLLPILFSGLLLVPLAEHGRGRRHPAAPGRRRSPAAGRHRPGQHDERQAGVARAGRPADGPDAHVDRPGPGAGDGRQRRDEPYRARRDARSGTG